MTQPPTLRWDLQASRLVGPDGQEVTAAQDAKARRYNELDLIREASRYTGEAPWGQPWQERITYWLEPLPGTHLRNEVVVVLHYDAADRVVLIDYHCRCQKARGTNSVRPGTCSHTLAVHRYRKNPNPKKATP